MMLPFLIILFAALIAWPFYLVRESKASERRSANPQQALTFPLPGIAEELAAEEKINLYEALRREIEFRRWFAATAASSMMIGMNSEKVDAFWHVLLRHNELYEAFSQAVAGRVITHHEGVGNDQLSARGWAAYKAMWGTPPGDLWDRPPEKNLQRVRVDVRRERSSASDTSSDGGSLMILGMADGCDASGHDSGGSDSGSGDGGSHSGCGSGCGGGCGGD